MQRYIAKRYIMERYIKRYITALLLLALAGCVLSRIETPGEAWKRKTDPLLRQEIESLIAGQMHNKRVRCMANLKRQDEDLMKLMKARGFEVLSISGNVALGEVLLSDIPKVAEIEDVIYVEEAGKLNLK